METERPDQELNPEYIAWAKKRMKEMFDEAEAATKALGLPRERKFDVLSLLYGGKRSLLGAGEGKLAPKASTDKESAK